jgi:hypothetical protein
MTLLAGFRNAAKVDGYIVPDTFAGGVQSLASNQWKDKPVRWQTWAGNQARRKFVESLKREYPEIASAIKREIEPLLQQNGKPLESWHVRRVLEKVEALGARVDRDVEEFLENETANDPANSPLQMALDENAALEARSKAPSRTDEAGNDLEVSALLAEFDKSVDFASRTRREQVVLAASPPTGLAQAFDQFGKDLADLERDCAAGLIGKRESKEMEPEQVIFTSLVPESPPPQVPSQAVVQPKQPPAQSRWTEPQRERSTALTLGSRGGNLLPHRHANETVAKSSEPPAADEKRAAKNDLYDRFNTIAAAVAEAKKEAEGASEANSTAKKKGVLTSLRRSFSNSKAKTAKGEDTVPTSNRNKSPLSDADKKFVELFAPVPNLATLDDMLAEKEVTVVPLSKYLDLPNMMMDWRARLAESKTHRDAMQVSDEIYYLLMKPGAGGMPGGASQLEMDRGEIEKLINGTEGRKLSSKQKEALFQVLERLDAIQQEVTSPDSPIWKLFEHSTAIMKALANENQNDPPKFSKADKGEESQFLKSIGIPYGEDKNGERIALANRMAIAHTLVLNGLHNRQSWNEILTAHPDERELLEEYEKLRLEKVMDRITDEAKTEISFDPTDRTFTIAASGLRAERARYVLRDIAVAMGGVRDPLTIFGYVEDGGATS